MNLRPLVLSVLGLMLTTACGDKDGGAPPCARIAANASPWCTFSTLVRVYGAAAAAAAGGSEPAEAAWEQDKSCRAK